jgi:cell division protein FtsL
MKKREKKNWRERAPLLKVRHLGGMILAVSLMVALPLGIVWKQVYITQTSMRQDRLSDSLNVLNKQAAQLRLQVEMLSRTSRIELIARQRLGLDYPSASQIVRMKAYPDKNEKPAIESNYIAILKRSITREKG